MPVVAPPTAPIHPARGARARLVRELGWQGFLVDTPGDWELTGYSGTFDEGYFRADDGDALGIEVKWSTPKGRSAAAVDLGARRDAYLSSLRKAARRRKAAFEESETPVGKGVVREDRTAVGFAWSADRKADGALWMCATCGRVVMAQVVGETSGRKGFAGVAEAVLGAVRCHGEDPAVRKWSLYGLSVSVSSEYALQTAQLMNVYLRLAFERGTARVSVEQWSAADAARRGRYLDQWLSDNSRGELAKARTVSEEASVHGHPAVRMVGGLAVGMPLLDAVREVSALRAPATRYHGVGWECPVSNTLNLVQSLRAPRVADPVPAVVASLRCHFDGASGVQGT
ncbi:MAG: hypothetical protein ACKO5K_01160 [Armatimonadota bacterium]